MKTALPRIRVFGTAKAEPRAIETSLSYTDRLAQVEETSDMKAAITQLALRRR